MSQSENSHTAVEILQSQLQLESDAREALPYQFDTCTRPLGPLRQLLFSCLTCNPPPGEWPEPSAEPSTAPSTETAAVCYSCSISCHGDHQLVELFAKRNFVCDCGTTRFSTSTTPCCLQIDPATNTKGGLRAAPAASGNRYMKNFQNRFCGCDRPYDAEAENGTMFQCVGLDGGCGEDWWHPECIVGLGLDWNVKPPKKTAPVDGDAANDGEENAADDDDDPPAPPGFPDEDSFEAFVCHVCTDANPWVKQLAGLPGLSLPPVFFQQTADTAERPPPGPVHASLKRKADSDDIVDNPTDDADNHPKRPRPDDAASKAPLSVRDLNRPAKPAPASSPPSTCLSSGNLPSAPAGRFSVFFVPDFREKLCKCEACLGRLAAHPGLMEEEDMYEPPLSESGSATGNGHNGSAGSLYDRGTAALSSVDRVRAIEGLMVYNDLKDKVKSFLKPFADSGTAVSAEDIKSYFAQLRGDRSNPGSNVDQENVFRRQGRGY